MIVREVHTALEHEVNGKKHIGSFLYLEEVSEWDLEQLTKKYRSKIVDPKSKAYLDGQPYFDVMAWFVSVDGNFLVLRHLSMDWEVRQVNTHTIERLDFHLEGNLPELLRQLRERLSGNPAASQRIFKNAKLSSGRLPKRIKFSEITAINLEEIFHSMYRVEPSSPDDTMACVIISGLEYDSFGKNILEMCKGEATRRFEQRNGHADSFFNFRDVSPAELEARHNRGKDTLAKFNNKFPVDYCIDTRVIGHEEWEWEVKSYLQPLSDDVLAELLLVFFASDDGQNARAKVLYSCASERMTRNFR
jgi:hypothetical protein